MSRQRYDRWFALPACLICFCVVVFYPHFSAAQAPTGGPGGCAVLPDNDWNDTEQWVWSRLCKGEVANFRAAAPSQDCPDRDDAAPVTRDNLIRPKFLQTLLFGKTYREALPTQGVRIIGAIVTGALDLGNSQPTSQIWIESSIIEGNLTLAGMITQQALNFCNTTIHGAFDANSVTARRLEMVGANVDDKMDLTGAKIGGYLVMKCVRVSGEIWADYITVDGFALLDHAVLGKRLFIRYGKFGTDVHFNRSRLTHLNLSGATIQGEILFDDTAGRHSATCDGEPATSWSPPPPDLRESQLSMRNTSTAAWRGVSTGWPSMQIDGFTYKYVKIDGLDAEYQLGSWATDWLASDRSSSFQPYEQMADTLTKNGLASQAGDVLYAGRERERATSHGWHWFWMTAANWLIGYGYGYRYFYALVWAAVLIVLGWWLIDLSGENRDREFKLGVLYSIDMLLPLIQYDKKNYEVEISNSKLRIYFLFHRTFGYILGAFILAGISGITK